MNKHHENYHDEFHRKKLGKGLKKRKKRI